MSRNNARKKAARQKQVENPGMSYQAAWNAAGADQQKQIVDEVLAGLKETYAKWEGLLESMDAVAAQAADTTQPRFHDDVAARFDGNGALTALDIDPVALSSYTMIELGAIVTEVVQRTWDAVMSAVIDEYNARGWDGGVLKRDTPGTFTEASRNGALKLAVNGAGRLLWCELGEQIVAGAWTAAEVGERILVLHQAAVMRAWREIGRPLDEPKPDHDRDTLIPSDAAIAQYRAAQLTFLDHACEFTRLVR